jgi:hypothetical protein
LATADSCDLKEVALKFAKWVYRIAGIYGLLVLAPLLFLERAVSQNYLPAALHKCLQCGWSSQIA